jgi:protein-S-isoprenylcysteine O-methyltransferase Ste14
MNPAVFLLLLLDLGFIASLPWIFYKPGRFHWRWWVTALPFWVTTLFLLLVFAGTFHRWGGNLTIWSELIAVPAASGSIALIAFTLGTHRKRLALWHQDVDPPEEIVTLGPYRWIRHPFYAAFLLALGAVFLAAPHPVTLSAFLYGVVALNLTAAGEERRLAASELGAEYRAYMERTGRFLPRLTGRRELNG